MQNQQLEWCEDRRLEEQAQLDKTRSALERNRLGQYATPPALAAEVIGLALEAFKSLQEPIHFLDPAFGTGALFSALLKQVGAERILSAVGIELDQQVVGVARRLWSDQHFSADIIEADFTTLPPPSQPTANLIICNPPYVRHHYMMQSAKPILQAIIKDTIGIQLNGLAGLYCYFMLLSHLWLKDNGIGVWLIPAEFMDVNFGKALRRYLLTKVRLVQVHNFDPSKVQFDDALVSSAIVVFEKRQPSADHHALFTYGDSSREPARAVSLSATWLATQNKWPRRPFTLGRAPRLQSGFSITFGDLFLVQRGIATGANSFFIMTEQQALSRDIPREFVRPVLPSPRHIRNPVVQPDTDGFPLAVSRLVLLDCPLSPSEVESYYPQLWKYLLEGVAQGIDKRHLTSRRHPWYKQEQRRPTQFLVTYMGRRRNGQLSLRFIWNQSNAVATNVYHVIYPKPLFATYLAEYPKASEQVYKLLNQITELDLIENGRTHGGGLHKLEPRELYQLPVSNLEGVQGLSESVFS